MKSYKGYLIDLDGTLYRGREVIPGALAFIRALRQHHIPHLYLTNNSSRTPSQVAEKLQGMGFPADPDQVITSSMVAAQVLKSRFGSPSVYAIGEEGLLTALREAGCRENDKYPDAVVVGIDRSFTYEKMKTACLAIRSGARFFGTNGDLALPSEEGLLPGNGSLCAGIAAATGVEPEFTGKPEKVMMEFALERLGFSKEETLIVGDNLWTDIRGGVDSGIDTLLVFSGYTTPEEYEDSPIRAKYTVPDLNKWHIQGGLQ